MKIPNLPTNDINININIAIAMQLDHINLALSKIILQIYFKANCSSAFI